jgi:hypothetical protein
VPIILKKLQTNVHMINIINSLFHHNIYNLLDIVVNLIHNIKFEFSNFKFFYIIMSKYGIYKFTNLIFISLFLQVEIICINMLQ